MEEKRYICIKCKKNKKESKGMIYMDGVVYCCKKCCPKKKKGEKKEANDNSCEFC